MRDRNETREIIIPKTPHSLWQHVSATTQSQACICSADISNQSHIVVSLAFKIVGPTQHRIAKRGNPDRRVRLY